MTNSVIQAEKLAHIAPTRFIMLASDPDLFNYEQDSQSVVGLSPYSDINVTYLGHYSLSKPLLSQVLRQSRLYGLSIFGWDWSGTEFEDVWRLEKVVVVKEEEEGKLFMFEEQPLCIMFHIFV